MPAIGALGSLAGGLLAKAIMPEVKALKTDSSIAGVTNASLGESPSTGLDVNVAQVDPSQALAYFMQAATGSQGFYQSGLSLYQNSINEAKKEITNSYRAANRTLAPMASGGMSAFNEMLRYMGIDPVPVMGGVDRIGAYSSDLAKQMRDANSIKDPTARAQARQQIGAQINQLKSDIATKNAFTQQAPGVHNAQIIPSGKGVPNASQLAASQAITSSPEFAEYYKNKMSRTYDPLTVGSTGAPLDPRSTAGMTAAAKAYANWNTDQQAKAAESQQAYAAWQASKDANAASIASQQSELEEIWSEFNSNYADTYDRGYTGQEITDKLRATPGYQFRYDQGSEAVQRSAAAKGNLLSGRTLSELTTFGQGVADQTFQQALANLSSIASLGLPAQTALASNALGEGASKASLSTMGGNAAANTYNLIGNQYANAYTNQGQGFLSAAQFNADWQNKAMFQDRDHQSQMAQQAVSSGPGYMNAQTNANAFNYNVFQNQQAGQAAMGGGGGWNLLPVGGSTGSSGNPPASYGITL